MLNIYSKKQQWKLLLATMAMIIVLASLWYTNILVRKIAQEEKNKVTLWAEAIQKKAALVNYTTKLFEKLAQEERNKVEIWAEANKLITAENTSNLNFLVKILSGNTSIPVMIVDENNKILSHRNFDVNETDELTFLKQELENIQNLPIDMSVRIGNYTLNQKLYYKDSKIYAELKEVLDNLIQSFISEIVINSASVPVIYTDSTQQNILEYGNLDSKKVKNNAYLENILLAMKKQNEPIEIIIDNHTKNYIFYKDSILLQQLKYYPFFQFLVIGLFLLIAYYLFSTSRKAEQNQVWIGMAKETAHQLGTPLSSLIAWIELLKDKGIDNEIVVELKKDTTRLEMITDRFSKIGAVPDLKLENLNTTIREALNYLKPRISTKVSIELSCPNEIYAKLSPSLFSWVLENLIKNAADSMKGNGNIKIEVVDQTQYVYVDVSDNGAGIPRGKFKTVFEPGYTTKKRGWGLGLSLVKRIIENYHSGKIFVKRSNDAETTFRMVLNK